MSLIFLGDIAYPYNNAVDIKKLQHLFAGKIAIANLEGPIIDDLQHIKVYDSHKYNLYSDTAVFDIFKALNIRAVSVANNHFCDFKEQGNNTIKLLAETDVDYFGTKSKQWSYVKDKDTTYALYGAYTYPTGGNRRRPLLNLFDAKAIVDEVKALRNKNKEVVIIIFIHWGYELAFYPQPADREWAHAIIDAGANAVIGHHPHVIQPIEPYKDSVIAYSLGNFLLPQVMYLDKNLQYKSDKVLEELILEINFDQKLTFVPYKVCYRLKEGDLIQEEVDKSTFSAPFEGFSNTDYLEWFKHNVEQNRYPIYHTYKNRAKIKLNNAYIKALKTVRKTLMITGLHNPIKKGTEE